MSAEGASRFPPRRFPELTETQLKWLRPLWYLALAAAVLLDIFGTVYVIRDTYDRDPHFAALGLVSQVEDDGSVTVESMVHDGRQAIAPLSRIVAVDGKPLRELADTPETVAALAAATGPVVELTVGAPDGSIARHRIERSGRYRAAVEREQYLSLDQRMGIRLAIALLTCATLIACAVLLVLRRPRDPVCLLFSFAFLLFAATIDPPLTMWLGTGWGTLFDWISSAGWLCLVMGIAVFPDGRFEPRWLSWLVVAAPVGAILLTLDDLPLAGGAIIAFAAPLALLGGIAIKYRSYPAGIERQQIKWGAWGFASGLTSVATAFILLVLDLGGRGAGATLYNLAIVSLFTLGFLMLALGLLVALLRFRLWEADRVISRSAIYAIVAALVGIVWAASIDFLKFGVEYALGEENKPVATGIGAVLAAGLFAPTQAMLLRWTKRRFNADGKRMETLIARLHAWRTTETPAEIATRALASIAAVAHPGSSALLVDTPLGRELLAARDVADPQALAAAGADPARDPRVALSFPLEDEDGPIGLLLLGPRSDGNRYNEDERTNLHKVLEPLAEALRIALKRRDQTDRVHRLIGSVEERLTRLEGDQPSPAAG